MAKKVLLRGSYASNPFEMGIDVSPDHLSATRVIRPEFSYQSFIHNQCPETLTLNLTASENRKDHSVGNMHAYLRANPSLLQGSSQHLPLIISFVDIMAKISVTDFNLSVYQRRKNGEQQKRYKYPDTFKEPIDITKEGSFAAFPYRSNGQFIIFIRPWNSDDFVDGVKPVDGYVSTWRMTNSKAGLQFERKITMRHPIENDRMLYIVTEPQLKRPFTLICFGELDAVQEQAYHNSIDLGQGTEIKTSKNDATLAVELVVLQHVTCSLMGIPLILRASQQVLDENVVSFENIRYYKTADASAFEPIPKKSWRKRIQKAVSTTQNFDYHLMNIMCELISTIVTKRLNAGPVSGWVEVKFSAGGTNPKKLELLTEWVVHEEDDNPLCDADFIHFMDEYFMQNVFFMRK